MKTPSVQLKPSHQPLARAQAATSRTVVVLPFDPVMAAIGMRVQRRPRHRVGRRQRIERPALAALAGTERQRRLVEQVTDAARTGGLDQRDDVGSPFACRAQRQSGQCGVFLQHRRNDVGRIAGVLEVVRQQVDGDVGPADRIALEHRRAERPLVEFGRGEELVDGRLQRERHARRVPARDDGGGERRARRGPVPAQVPTRTFDPRAPAGQQRIVDFDADRFQHRAGAGEEQVPAHQTTRVVEGQGVFGVQSSVSGAIHTPRSSRMTPGMSCSVSSPASCVPTTSAGSAGAGRGAGLRTASLAARVTSWIVRHRRRSCRPP